MSDQMSEVPVEEQLGPPPEPPNVLSLTPVEVKSEELEQNDGHEDHESIDMSPTQQPNEEQESQQKEVTNEDQMESHETHKPEEPLQESHEEQEPQEEDEEDNRHEDNDEDNDEDDDNEDDYDNEEHDDNDEHEDNEEPEQMIYEMDVNLLKDENQKLSEDVQFAQNIIKLLENYRNLMIVCLNNCQNCSQNQVLVQEFNELELTYDKDLNYAKDIVFDKSFYNKINRIFNKKKKNPNERKYEILDDYIESDSDEKNSLDPIEDSDYEPIEEPLVENDEKPKKRQKRTPKAKKSKTGRKRTKKTRNYDIIEEEIDDIIDHLGSNVEEEEQDMAWNPSHTKRKGRGRPKGSTPKAIKVKGPKKRYDKLYKCDFCEYTHRKPPNLEAHKNKVHLNIRPYKCDKCEKSFTGKPFLDKHRRFHNESDSSYHYCDWTDCKFRTKYMNNLKEHRLRHERDRQFRCAWPGCGQSFYNNRDMTQHMKSHEDQRTYRCDWPGCESTFKRHTYLSRHKRLHINSDDAFPCVWPGCGKAFNTKKKLANHSTLHKKQLEENVQQMVRNIPNIPPQIMDTKMAKRSVIQSQPPNRPLQMSAPRMGPVPGINVPKMDNRLPAHTNQLQAMQASAQQFVRTAVQSALGDPTPTPTDLSQHRPTGQVYNNWSLNNFYH